jgi:multiple sugar transport system ATP-binding protein
MNFLSATRRQEGNWDAGGLVLDGPQSGHEKLELAVRPEDVTLADIGFRARVRIVEPLGPHQLVTCDIGGNSFRAVLDSDLRLTPGQAIALEPQRDRIRWFDPVTSLAVTA